MPRACTVESHAGRYTILPTSKTGCHGLGPWRVLITEDVRLHGANPWHLEGFASKVGLGLIRSEVLRRSTMFIALR